MSTNKPTLPSTIEIKPAHVHITGKNAGVIEVPILVNNLGDLRCDLDELYLQIEGEEHLLRPAGRIYFEGGLQVTFFSRLVRTRNQLPRTLQLHWGDPGDQGECGMDLDCHEAGPDMDMD